MPHHAARVHLDRITGAGLRHVPLTLSEAPEGHAQPPEYKPKAIWFIPYTMHHLHIPTPPRGHPSPPLSRRPSFVERSNTTTTTITINPCRFQNLAISPQGAHPCPPQERMTPNLRIIRKPRNNSPCYPHPQHNLIDTSPPPLTSTHFLSSVRGIPFIVSKWCSVLQPSVFLPRFIT